MESQIKMLLMDFRNIEYAPNRRPFVFPCLFEHFASIDATIIESILLSKHSFLL